LHPQRGLKLRRDSTTCRRCLPRPSTCAAAPRSGASRRQGICVRLSHTSCIGPAFAHSPLASCRQLTAHLRTPPAPTFAPLFVVQLSLCAKVAADTCTVLYGPDSSSDEGLCGMYAALQGAAADSTAIVLPLRSPHSGKPLTRRQRAIVARAAEKPRGAAEPRDLSWLPLRLQRPSRPSREAEAAGAATNTPQLAQAASSAKQPASRTAPAAPAAASAPPGMDDDEDLGEAI
jgi:hypothetical protein